MSDTLLFSHGYMDSDKDREEYVCNAKLITTNNSVGHCKYYRKDPSTDVVYIEYLYINLDQRRKGYATQFVKELQRKYTLHWDYSFTPEGRLWYEKLQERRIV